MNTVSYRIHGYVQMFLEQLLNINGVSTFKKEYKRIFGDSAFETVPRANLVKFMLGFTRHREYLTDAWSDDTALWLPRKDLASM